jgi:hypothetical protein
VAVLFARNPWLGPDFDPDVLHGILITEHEFNMVRATSPYRVLSALGRLYRYYPWPYWSDPSRPEVYGPDSLEATLVPQTPCLHCEGAYATTSGDSVRATIPLWAATELAETLAASEVVTVTLGREPGIRAAFAWMPGDDQPTAIHAEDDDASRIVTWFLMFVASEAEVDDVGRREDGVTVLLTPKTAMQLADALRAGSAISISGGATGMDLSIAIADQ